MQTIANFPKPNHIHTHTYTVTYRQSTFASSWAIIIIMEATAVVVINMCILCKEWCIAALLPENNFLSKQNMSIMQINDIAITRIEHVAKCKRIHSLSTHTYREGHTHTHTIERIEMKKKERNNEIKKRTSYNQVSKELSSESHTNRCDTNIHTHATSRPSTEKIDAEKSKWSNKSRSYESKLC